MLLKSKGLTRGEEKMRRQFSLMLYIEQYFISSFKYATKNIEGEFLVPFPFWACKPSSLLKWVNLHVVQMNLTWIFSLFYRFFHMGCCVTVCPMKHLIFGSCMNILPLDLTVNSIYNQVTPFWYHDWKGFFSGFLNLLQVFPFLDFFPSLQVCIQVSLGFLTWQHVFKLHDRRKTTMYVVMAKH
jgi:hypothetical protein